MRYCLAATHKSITLQDKYIICEAKHLVAPGSGVPQLQQSNGDRAAMGFLVNVAGGNNKYTASVLIPAQNRDTEKHATAEKGEQRNYVTVVAGNLSVLKRLREREVFLAVMMGMAANAHTDPCSPINLMFSLQ